MFRRIGRFLTWFVVLAIVLPIGIGAVQGYARGWPENWRVADWGSSHVLPGAADVRPATVLVLAARTGQWKSIFAEHMSIVLKPEGASQWTRYDVVGWGAPVRRDEFVADAFWYGNRPRVVFQLQGDEAGKLIPLVEASIAAYPNQARGSYAVWPGPNSNTFVSWVVRQTPGLDVDLPPAAVGKDWLGPRFALAPAPSKTGYSASLAGVIGVTVAWREGLELNLLGATIGIDPDDVAIKLPALGKLSLLDLSGPAAGPALQR